MTSRALLFSILPLLALSGACSHSQVGEPDAAVAVDAAVPSGDAAMEPGDAGSIPPGDAASSAALASLVLSSGRLSPAFSSSTFSYTATVPGSIGFSLFHVTPTSVDPAAMIAVNGAPVASGSASATIALSSTTPTPVDITVTASDGVTVEHTTLVVSVVTSSELYFKASIPGTEAQFGRAVAISNDTLVVCAPGENGGSTGVGHEGTGGTAMSSGAVYVFVRAGGVWTQQAYIKASNSATGLALGTAIALDGDTFAVASLNEASHATGVDGDQTDTSMPSAGAVYVFARSGTTWSQQAYVKASNTRAQSRFGASLALSGDTLVVGADQESSAATGVNGDQTSTAASMSGAAYVFTRSGATWSQQAYLKASNTRAGAVFGRGVAIDGDRIAIGSPYESSGATGVGGDQTSTSAPMSGAVYVFSRAGATWTQDAYLKSSNTQAMQGSFGYRVSLAGDTLAVGAPLESSASQGVGGTQTGTGATHSGAVYVFTRAATSWSQQAYIKASNSGVEWTFGAGLVLVGDTLLVGAIGEQSGATGVNGAQNDDSTMYAGAVYVLERSGTTWTQTAYLKASNTNTSQEFGDGLAFSGDTIAVGAAGESSKAAGIGGNQNDTSLTASGAVYVLE